jgi:hypothetical protein
VNSTKGTNSAVFGCRSTGKRHCYHVGSSLSTLEAARVGPALAPVGLKIHRAMVGLSKVSNTAPPFLASANPIQRPGAAAALLNQECRGEDVFGSISSIRFPKGSSTKILS